jgi:hypothetical protein
MDFDIWKALHEPVGERLLEYLTEADLISVH